MYYALAPTPYSRSCATPMHRQLGAVPPWWTMMSIILRTRAQLASNLRILPSCKVSGATHHPPAYTVCELWTHMIIWLKQCFPTSLLFGNPVTPKHGQCLIVAQAQSLWICICETFPRSNCTHENCCGVHIVGQNKFSNRVRTYCNKYIKTAGL